jgi:hypothetical protein
MAKKLTDKQIAKVKGLIGEGLDAEKAKEVIQEVYQGEDYTVALTLKVAKKELSRQLNVIDKALAIVAPPKVKE